MRLRFASNATLRSTPEATNIRAIHEGSVSLLLDNIRERLLDAYNAMGAANAMLDGRDSQVF
jgi:hypothetical protein